MSVLGDIRAGIVNNFDAFYAGTIPYNQFTGYLLTPPQPPCFEIDFPEDALVFDIGGSDNLRLIVRGIVELNEPDEAQQLLDEWLDNEGATSVKAAIESDPTLGGKVANLNVTSATGHRRLGTPDGAAYLAAEWTVEVFLTP